MQIGRVRSSRKLCQVGKKKKFIVYYYCTAQRRYTNGRRIDYE